MTGIIKVNELQGRTTAGNITVTSEGGAATMQLQQGLLKSWVNIDTDSTVGILDSVGITSISDNGSGNFYINLSNNMNNSSYSPVGTVDGSGFTINVHTCQTDGRNTAQYRVYSFSGSGTASDYDSLMYHTAGDLA